MIETSTIQVMITQLCGMSSPTVAPTPRGGATITQVANGDIYVIGGADRTAISYSDVWKFYIHTKEWEQVFPANHKLTGRSGHSAAANGEYIVVFGGMNSQTFDIYNDIHILDTKQNRWLNVKVKKDKRSARPKARNSHIAVMLPSKPSKTGDSSRSSMVIYGGSSPTEGNFTDIWLLHVHWPCVCDNIFEGVIEAQWEKIESNSSSIPLPRELHSANLIDSRSVELSVVDTQNENLKVFIYGGRGGNGCALNELWSLDTSTWEWQSEKCTEWTRCSHTTGQLDGKLIIFGGWDGDQIVDNFSVYNKEKIEWNVCSIKTDSTTHIAGRFGHSSCDVKIENSPNHTEGSSTSQQDCMQNTQATQGFVIFGGMNAETDFNDMYLVQAI